MYQTYTIPEAHITVNVYGDDDEGFSWEVRERGAVVKSSKMRGEVCDTYGSALRTAFDAAVEGL